MWIGPNSSDWTISIRESFSNSKIARKSLVAKTKINKGELITYKNVTAKRPGNGKNPFVFIKMINKKSKKNYLKDQFI